MKAFAEDKKVRGMKEDLHIMHKHNGPGRHMPPHERKALMHVEFDENDWNLLKEVFGDEDTAVAASEIILEAPPEIQILVIQLINIIEEVS